MTDREIFERVKSHLLTQNAKSIDPEAYAKTQTNPTFYYDSGCRYRYNGLKCAVGCLITDEVYDAMYGLECKSVHHNDVVDALNASLDKTLLIGTRTMLGYLQTIHDEQQVVDWPKALDSLEEQLFGRQKQTEPSSAPLP